MTQFRLPPGLAVLLAPMIASCGPYLPLEGVVIDTTTGKPIGDAFVISQWTTHGGEGVGSRSGCPKVDVVTTNGQGRYRFPWGFTGVWFGDDRVVFAYKAGFADDTSKPFDNQAVSMKPFKGTAKERIDSFQTYGSLRSCGNVEEVVPLLRSIYEAIDQELADLHEQGPVTLPLGTYARSLQQLEEAVAIKRNFAFRPG